MQGETPGKLSLRYCSTSLGVGVCDYVVCSYICECLLCIFQGLSGHGCGCLSLYVATCMCMCHLCIFTWFLWVWVCCLHAWLIVWVGVTYVGGFSGCGCLSLWYGVSLGVGVCHLGMGFLWVWVYVCICVSLRWFLGVGVCLHLCVT